MRGRPATAILVATALIAARAQDIKQGALDASWLRLAAYSIEGDVVSRPTTSSYAVDPKRGSHAYRRSTQVQQL
jgi:hypothetical protein